ncbi:hypothetical protein, partial [Mangrovimicrobium sediminis]|uniref:hypothetical protein n=1 Tax=Mangrovimicrobium sediminis TaxID=2562682 RepID=UPI00198137DE
LALYVGMMGLAWMLDSPPLLRKLVPELDQVQSRTDPRIEHDETARAQLHLMTVFMNFWSATDYAAIIDMLEQRAAT